jgi:hypothetical protein
VQSERDNTLCSTAVAQSLVGGNGAAESPREGNKELTVLNTQEADPQEGSADLGLGCFRNRWALPAGKRSPPQLAVLPLC